ncbi:hypothetical protein K0U91_14270 [Chryseobacterium chendengshani]|uniref:hypothetical protein n=1 Tax=Chryseobacterium sp. LJ668 TaxID=2864040 RepID=UPI001C687CF6|nr:hypothetical protein [Chryseobacterium sp. LJ668]MBW8522671.1 hypothetical protein [Chryseobacterium sp. LJ668]QYK16206.1 hypothetical protein K0U91_14270 [Chryseobacterium sp. LJ668]
MKEFIIIRGLFDNRKRQLILNENFIKFENKDHKDDLFTIVNKNDIVGIRYGIHFIKGLEFYIGREYKIFIKTNSGKELKINFKLFYRRKLNEKHELYSSIIDHLWNYYLNDISKKYLDKIGNGIEFTICNIKFLSDRIIFNDKELLFKDVEIKNYYHYFIIYSKNDQYQNKMLYYLQDENAVIILNLFNIIKDEYH